MDQLAIALIIGMVLVLLNDTRVAINREKDKINSPIDDRDETEKIFD